jgi:hypothetical protein
MAVKPITNRAVVSKQLVNRAEHTSNKNLVDRGGNREQSIVPGKDLTKNYSITLKDLDSAIMSHIKEVIKPTVRESSEQFKVTVMYGNEERWKSARKRGAVRDSKGAFILPLIVFRRTAVERSDNLSGFQQDVQRKYAEVVRGSTWSKKNRYDRFAVQSGIVPRRDHLVTTMPNWVNLDYEFILWTNFIEQMNPLVETFVEHSHTYWGSSTDYRFLSKIDSISDATEMDLSGERFVKSTFSLSTQAYLLPEETNSIVTGKMSQLRKVSTIQKVSFTENADPTDAQLGRE